MLKEKLSMIEQFQDNVTSTGLELSAMPIRLKRTYTFELADDFNDGVLSPKWLRQNPSVPVESGGFLVFNYPNYNQLNSQVVFNSQCGMYELETRFICETLSNNILPYSDYFVPFGPAILGEPIITPPLTDAQRESKLVWECWTNWSPYTNFLAFLPFCYGANGVRYMWKQSENQWVIDPGPSGRQAIFLYNPAGIPITLKASISGEGVVIKAYKNDNVSQVIFETTQSPALRKFDYYYLQLAHAGNFGGGRTKYDYFKLSGPVIEPNYGELILRRSFPIKTKLKSYFIDRILNGSVLKLNIRSADDIETLNTSEFKQVEPELIVDNTETGSIELPSGLFFDFKLEFIKTGQSPLLNAFGYIFAPDFIEDEQPVILSVNESGVKQAMVTSSEEGLSETSNTKKLIDGILNTQWVSLNADDSIPVTLQITFLSGTGGNELRNIGCVILRNTNIKDIRIYAGIKTLFEGELLDENVFIPFELTSTPVIQIEARTTKTPNENKRIGECYCGQILAVLPGFDLYEPKVEFIEQGSMRTLKGKLVTYRLANKYSASWKIILTDETTTNKIRDVFINEPLITFWPEPKTKPSELYNVSWAVDVLSYPYTSQFKNAGYTISVEMTEL